MVKTILVCFVGVLMYSAEVSWGQTSDPHVVNYEAVSKTRVSRTQFDYVFAITIQSESDSYPDGATFTVSSDNPSTFIFDSTVAVDSLDAFSISKPTDTFTIRQNRTSPFDPAALHWQITGTAVSEPPPPLSVVTFAFLRERGRTGHAVLLPIQAPPSAGQETAALTLSVPAQGVSALFKRLDGSLLGEYALSSRDEGSPIPAKSWIGQVTIPSEPFFVAVAADTSPGETESVVVGETFTPSPWSVGINPGSLTLFSGESSNFVVNAQSPSSAGETIAITISAPPELNVTPAQIMLTLDASGAGAATFNASVVGTISSPTVQTLRVLATSTSDATRHVEASISVVLDSAS